MNIIYYDDYVLTKKKSGEQVGGRGRRDEKGKVGGSGKGVRGWGRSWMGREGRESFT